MNCKYHSDVRALGECRLCGTEVCSECVTIIKGNVLCPDCVERAAAGTGGQQSAGGHDMKTGAANRRDEAHIEPKSKFFTFFLSFLPGLGHLYLGLTRQGIELMALFFAVAWLSGWTGGFPLGFLVPVLFFYGIFDALQKRDRLARGEWIDTESTFFRNVNVDWFADKKWIGWTAIGLGVLLLLKELGAHFYYLHRFDDLIVAVLLVGVGVWMLQRERKVGKRPAGQKTTGGEERQDA
ncbi:hypothetical protein [Effusibacillus pohliae]|uniref:hypothetical protein n=1 Tax=Effusibacillus pohliae TaxID=232270 RepID=UPI000374174B|nr:hypothetical protein [Effusibacillus pohliae]